MTIRALIAAGVNVTVVLESALTRYGFACTCVNDGAAAAEAFGKERFDVVVLDTWLHRKPGLALAAEMRETLAGRNVGICIVNAEPNATIKASEALLKGVADAWFDIPFAPSDVRVKLAELALRATGAVAGELPVAMPAGLRTVTGAPAAAAAGAAAAAAAAAAPKTAAAPATATPGGTAPGGVQSLATRSAAEQMLDLCRAQATGVLVLKNRLAEARIAIARGVLVGASDNGHDNRLGPRLLRRGKVQPADATRIQQWMNEHKGRVGDAVLGLGLLDAATLLEELRLQTHERLLQAAVWNEGEARFVKDDAEVVALSVDAFDVIDVILRAFMRSPDDDAVARFVGTRARDAISASPDFEEGLVAYARVEPRSPLPLVLMSSSSSLGRVLATLSTFPAPDSGTHASHVRALWYAGLIRLTGDPARDPRPVPRPWKLSSTSPAAQQEQKLDAALIDAVQRVWLRVQGHDPYAALGVARDATSDEIARALAALESVAGRAQLEGKRLGPAETIARALGEFFDETRALLLDPQARTAFDGALGAKLGADDAIAAEELFLQGRLALVDGDVDKAMDTFRRALKLVPDDAEVRAWLGWAEFVDAAERLANAMALIKRAAHDNPSAARPLLFLARVSAQQGDREAAERFLREAQRRCPDDPDVAKELAAVTRRE